jgi:hypothetical protein
LLQVVAVVVEELLPIVQVVAVVAQVVTKRVQVYF